MAPWNSVPEWTSTENQGGGVAVVDLDNDGKPELIVLRVDHPIPGPNRGFYRVGKGLDATARVTAGWGPWIEIPGWNSGEDEGSALAVADLDNDGRPELVVFRIAHRVPGPNQGHYRVGKGLDASGNVTGRWGPWIDVPNWISVGDQGGAVAIGDVDGDGKLDLVVFHIQDFHTLNATRPNKGFYRVGRSLDASGLVTGGWGDWHEVDWFSWFNQGAGLALADLDLDGNQELIVFQIDDPPQGNAGFYRVGWKLDAEGFPRDGWGPWVQVPNWGSWEDQGGGFALAKLDGGKHPKALLFQIDNPAGLNVGLFRADDLVVDLDTASTLGIWRLIPYPSEVLPVHAALLHTGQVLFFAGSGNNAFRFNSPDLGNEAKRIYTSVVWDPEGNTFDHPHTLRRPDPVGTVIDFFCCGHCTLPDGKILVAGGTIKYDTDIKNGVQVPATDGGFFGTRETVIFDPGTGQWSQVATMADGRWYPTLLMLADGQTIATSGLGSGGNPNQTIERNPDPEHTGWAKARNFGLPLYPHLFLLKDGRVLYTGGKMDTDGDSDPLRFDPLNPTASELIDGLEVRDQCNQSASVILPPAQDQKFMIMGGGPEDEGDATDRVSIVDMSMTTPRFTTATGMNFDRMHVNAVLLPDRTVLAVGGGGTREAKQVGSNVPQLVLERMVAEIFDPAIPAPGVWNPVAKAQVPRLYHSVALLLPDGRVVTAGGNPNKGSQAAWLPADSQEEERIEIFSPPYLFQGGTRPSIDDAPAEIHYGQKVTVKTAQASQVKWVNLIRPGVTTHSFNVEQRLVDLPFVVGTGSLSVTIPTEANIATPGHYMLFLTDNKGVPSTGRWTHLG
jgi:Domain of unknown function (DUF1929)